MSVNDIIADEQLPEWMIQAKRGIDWGALFIIAFCTIAGWSYIEHATLSATSANEAYIYRITDYTSAFEDGLLYTRWSPHALSTYGAPIPYFYPSGASYIGGIITFLFTNDPLVTVRLMYIFAFVIAGSMMYTFVTQRTTAFAGIIAAILYIFNPFILVSIGTISGDLPLAMGTALLPTLVWATNRLLLRYQPIDFILIALITGITIITIPIILLQSIIFILILLSVEFKTRIDWTKLLVIVGAISTGALLSAFYWVPALSQYRIIEWHPALINPQDIHITWMMLLQFNPSFSMKSAIHYPIYALGWGMITAVAFNLVYVVVRHSTNALIVGCFILGFILIGMMLIFVPHHPVWLILILFCFAIVGSSIGQFTTQKPSQLQYLAGWAFIILTLALSATTWVRPQTFIPIEVPTPQDQLDYERLGWGYAGLPSGYSLPSHMPPQYAFNNPFFTEYNPLENRLVGGTFTPILSQTPFSGTYSIDNQGTTTLLYNRAYFPLWQAQSNTEVTIRESTSHILEVTIPADFDSPLSIRLAPDLITTLAWGISLSALILCSLIVTYRWQQAQVSYDKSILLGKTNIRAMALILILLAVVRSGVVTSPQTMFQVLWKPSLIPNLSEPFVVDNTLSFDDYQISKLTYQSSERLYLSTFWNLLNPVEDAYLIRLRLVENANRTNQFQTEFRHIGYFPTSRWQTNTQVEHRLSMQLPAELNSGSYSVFIDVYQCAMPCFDKTASIERTRAQFLLTNELTIID